MRRISRRIVLSAMSFWNGWCISITISQFTARYLLDAFPQQRPELLRAVPLGVRQSTGLKNVDTEMSRANLGFSEDDFVLLSLGRIVPRKGHHITVEAIRLLPQEMRNVLVWYVVGPEIDAKYAAQVKADAADLGVRVVFAGTLPAAALEHAFAAANLFCVPSIWGASGEFEGFGLVYIEAGLRGLASVATTVGGIPDAVVNGKTGVLVPPEDPEALATVLARLWEDPSLLQQLSRAAYAHAREATWQNVATQTYADV